MTIQELNKKYYFHDSMITEIHYSQTSQELEIIMDFCNWAQKSYENSDPELLKLKIKFEGVLDYDGITGEIDYFSILIAEVKNDKFHLIIEDDFNQQYYEYYFSSSNVETEVIGIVED